MRSSRETIPGPYPAVAFANKTWRRSPFVVHTMLFRGAHKIDGLEVIGQVDLPPEGFRCGTRRPSDAVDFETGAGAWHVWSEETGGEIVTWLSSALARWPYTLRIHSPFLGAFYHQPELYPEHEINRRAIAYGLARESQGAKPTSLRNPAEQAPPLRESVSTRGPPARGGCRRASEHPWSGLLASNALRTVLWISSACFRGLLAETSEDVFAGYLQDEVFKVLSACIRCARRWPLSKGWAPRLGGRSWPYSTHTVKKLKAMLGKLLC